MATQEMSSPIEGVPYHPKQGWDMGAISAALDQTPELATDIAHGSGIRYALADGALTVELFPPHAECHTGIVRLSTPDSLQEFYRQPQPAIREEGLIFETSDLLISLSPTGELMTYRRVAEECPQAPSDASHGGDEGSDTPDDNSGRSGDPRATGTVFQHALVETEEQPRVTYTGRLGTGPRTKLTPKGRFVMEFPVAVPIEGREKPEWRSTVVFDEKARKLDGVLSRGTAVDVVAYEHRKVSRDAKTGKRRERSEYYATAVTPKRRQQRTMPGATGNDLERPTAPAVAGDEGAERPTQPERSARPGTAD